MSGHRVTVSCRPRPGESQSREAKARRRPAGKKPSDSPPFLWPQGPLVLRDVDEQVSQNPPRGNAGRWLGRGGGGEQRGVNGGTRRQGALLWGPLTATVWRPDQDQPPGHQGYRADPSAPQEARTPSLHSPSPGQAWSRPPDSSEDASQKRGGALSVWENRGPVVTWGHILITDDSFGARALSLPSGGPSPAPQLQEKVPGRPSVPHTEP